MAHRLSCSAACGIFPDQGSNPCSLRVPQWRILNHCATREASKPTLNYHTILQFFKKLQNYLSNLTPHFTDKKASTGRSAQAETTEVGTGIEGFLRGQVSWLPVPNSFQHTRSSGPNLRPMKKSFLLNTFNSGKKKSPCTCHRVHSSYLWYFSKLSSTQIRLAPRLSVALLFPTASAYTSSSGLTL